MAVSIWLDPEIEQRLIYLVAQTGRAKSYYLRELDLPPCGIPPIL